MGKNREKDICLTEIAATRPKIYLALLLCLIMVLNYYDIMHTVYVYSSAAAAEGNPLMAALLNTSPRLAVSLKMAAAILFTIVMLAYSKKQFRRAFLISVLITFVYLLVALWHLFGMHITNWLA
ncbi:MAG TPA: DUF5658 family protein [Syntrophomonadaceae bacterium]|nr:DUF5658 family protein [Syntrophomonadaceae bacterium]HPR94416.1 DUF5658 family protein [Syntrophomonadaceae bacterium]